MKSEIFTGRAGFLHVTVAVLSFLICQCQLVAQSNTSYNANTIPIGGSANTAFGVDALKVNTGSNNSAHGVEALYSNTFASNNTANGYRALYSNISGDFNTANGSIALYSNTTGIGNTANGYRALYTNNTGSQNVANGYYALSSNANGSQNTANGTYALSSNTSGIYNTATGMSALVNNTIGNYNTANGTSALASNTSGNYNTASGVFSLMFNSSGQFNSAYGYRALGNSSTGSYNTALGDSAGLNSHGNRNLFLGHKAGANDTLGNNKMYIGNNDSNTIVYGDFASRQVLMGVANATGYVFKGSRTLNVVGGILTDSVWVAPSSTWSDFVFDDKYKLLPLKELESFVKINKHLPDIPAAAEVAKNGFELSHMNAKLLEKVEVLTLYILQQQKQNEDLQKQIDELKRLIRAKQ